MADLTEELLDLLDPGLSINFQIWNDGSGTPLYVNALLGTSDSLSQQLHPASSMDARNLNFPSAYSYLEAGYAIGREGWAAAGQTAPAKWLMVVEGVVCIGTEGNWSVITSRKTGDGNILPQDLTAKDWLVAAQVSSLMLPRPDLEVKF